MKRTPEGNPSKRALIEKPPLAVLVKPDAQAPAADADSEQSRQARTREAAYALYEARGRVDGHDLEDWLAAEAALAAESERAQSRTPTAPH